MPSLPHWVYIEESLHNLPSTDGKLCVVHNGCPAESGILGCVGIPRDVSAATAIPSVRIFLDKRPAEDAPCILTRGVSNDVEGMLDATEVLRACARAVAA